jgi:hypothetical protein
MSTFNLKSYRPGTPEQEGSFYILSKGLNSGKPMNQPCPNCFVCTFPNQESRNKAYWLMYFLWQTKAFHIHLKGSVIPFIRIKDVEHELKQNWTKQKDRKLDHSLTLLNQIEQQRLRHQAIVATLNEMKLAVLQKQLK